MKVFYSGEVIEFLGKLTIKERARVERVRKLFEGYGFAVGPKYIKKIAPPGLWELRAGKIRLFLCIRGDKALGVHIIYKKSQKIPKKDIKLAEKRCSQT